MPPTNLGPMDPWTRLDASVNGCRSAKNSQSELVQAAEPMVPSPPTCSTDSGVVDEWQGCEWTAGQDIVDQSAIDQNFLQALCNSSRMTTQSSLGSSDGESFDILSTVREGDSVQRWRAKAFARLGRRQDRRGDDPCGIEGEMQGGKFPTRLPDPHISSFFWQVADMPVNASSSSLDTQVADITVNTSVDTQRSWTAYESDAHASAVDSDKPPAAQTLMERIRSARKSALDTSTTHQGPPLLSTKHNGAPSHQDAKVKNGYASDWDVSDLSTVEATDFSSDGGVGGRNQNRPSRSPSRGRGRSSQQTNGFW